MLPIDPIYVAVAILVGGVFASLLPFVPGGLMSMLGLGYYWSATGEPGTLAFAALMTVAAVIVLLDWLGSALSARVGGASLQTTAVAGLAALVGMLFLGPVGALGGIAGAVFALEFRRHGDIRRGVRTAAYATVGMLASTAMQLVLTTTVLVAFLVVVLL